eukprot:jgi/Botrbrau1/19997/Bobra.200_1s0007.2
MLCYSPFAFASKELEAAFQRDLPRRAGRILARYLLMGWGITLAITSRMFHKASSSTADARSAHILLQIFSMLLYTAGAATSFAAPKVYRQYWMAINTGLWLMMSVTCLSTWESMSPKPAWGPLTLSGVLRSYFIDVLTPVLLVFPGTNPLPLLLHIPAQAALLGGLFMVDSKLCSMRLASPDLPGQVDSLVKLITGVFPFLAPVFESAPSHNCVLVLSFGQALTAVAGTALMFWQEVSMRKAFLAEDSSARSALVRLPPHRVANFPYGHPKGVVLFLSVFTASVTVSMLLWEAFVFRTLSAAG